MRDLRLRRRLTLIYLLSLLVLKIINWRETDKKLNRDQSYVCIDIRMDIDVELRARVHAYVHV